LERKSNGIKKRLYMMQASTPLQPSHVADRSIDPSDPSDNQKEKQIGRLSSSPVRSMFT